LQIALHQSGRGGLPGQYGQRAAAGVEKYALPKVTQILFEEDCRILDAQKGAYDPSDIVLQRVLSFLRLCRLSHPVTLLARYLPHTYTRMEIAAAILQRNEKS
jgi:hypothetical protein